MAKTRGQPRLSEAESKRIVDGIQRLIDRAEGNKSAVARQLKLTSPALHYLLTGINRPSIPTARAVARLEQKPLMEYVDEFEPENVDPRWPSKARAAAAARALEHPEHAVQAMLEEGLPQGADRDPGAYYWLERVERLARFRPSGPSSAPPALPPHKSRNTPHARDRTDKRSR